MAVTRTKAMFRVVGGTMAEMQSKAEEVIQNLFGESVDYTIDAMPLRIQIDPAEEQILGWRGTVTALRL